VVSAGMPISMEGLLVVCQAGHKSCLKLTLV
jgi:hypothetical protein